MELVTAGLNQGNERPTVDGSSRDRSVIFQEADLVKTLLGFVWSTANNKCEWRRNKKKRLSPAVEIYIEEKGQKIHIKSNQIHPNQIEHACTVYSTANREGYAAGDLTSPIGDRVSKSGID